MSLDRNKIDRSKKVEQGAGGLRWGDNLEIPQRVRLVEVVESECGSTGAIKKT